MDKKQIHLNIKYSDGYNGARLTATVNGVLDRDCGCSGGGYDMTGKTVGNVLTAYTPIIARLKRLDSEDFKKNNYGYNRYYNSSGIDTLYIDGACGIDSMIRLAKNTGITVSMLSNGKNSRDYLMEYEPLETDIETIIAYKTISEVKQQHIRAYGGHFFDPDTMAFFGSKVYPTIYGGCYFITSEDNYNRTAKKYTIRKAFFDGAIDSVGDFNELETLEDAKKEVKKLVIKDKAKLAKGYANTSK